MSIEQLITDVMNSAHTEAEYQTNLRRLVRRGRDAVKTAQKARTIGHQRAQELTVQGIVTDPYREHALVDFETGLVEDNARLLKERTHRTLLMRKLNFGDEETKRPLSEHTRQGLFRRLGSTG